MGQQLGWYIDDTRALINDKLGMFVDDRRLTRYINQARQQVVKATRCLPLLVPGTGVSGASAVPGVLIPGGGTPGTETTSGFATIINQERYAYGYANPYVQRWNEGVDGILDVIQVAVSWGGSMRPALEWMPFDDFQAYLRSYQTLMTSYPAVWTTMGEGQIGTVFLFPVPSAVCEMEWTVVCNPKAIYTNDDYDAVPDPFSDAVKFWAANLAYQGSQRPGQAADMRAQFADHLGIDRASVDGGKVSSYYWTYP